MTDLSNYNPSDPEDCPACGVSPGPCPYHQGFIDGLNEARDADLIDDVARSLREAHDITWGHAIPDSHWDEKAREILAKVRGAQA